MYALNEAVQKVIQSLRLDPPPTAASAPATSATSAATATTRGTRGSRGLRTMETLPTYTSVGAKTTRAVIRHVAEQVMNPYDGTVTLKEFVQNHEAAIRSYAMSAAIGDQLCSLGGASISFRFRNMKKDSSQRGAWAWPVICQSGKRYYLSDAMVTEMSQSDMSLDHLLASA